jgi:hypothetical protein
VIGFAASRGENKMIEFKPYVFLVDFRQWRISLWDPIYWTRSETGLKIGGNLHSWEDQQQYDVTFAANAETTSAIEKEIGIQLEDGPLSKTYQKEPDDEQQSRKRQDLLMKLSDRLWLACKYAAIRRIETEPLVTGQDNVCEIKWEHV